MADPLSVTSGLLAIVTATIQSSNALYQAIQSFRDHPRAVRRLRDELQALDGVLSSLQAFSGEDPSILVPLKLPLAQCATACADFQELLVKCTKHSGGPKTTSFRDWVKLRYMDDDVNGFTDMLAGYKSTIAIALADANLRSSTVTLQVLHEYKDMIRNTKKDLEDHLEEINSKLQSFSPPSRIGPTMDVERFQNERDTTEQCLKICTEVLHHINELRLQPIPTGESLIRDISLGLSARELTHAHIMTLLTLRECSDKLSDTLYRLRAHGEDTKSRLLAGQAIQEPGGILGPRSEARKFASEFDSTRQCLAICSDASERASSGKVHVLDDITVGKDGKQMLIATLGELFNARRVKIGEGAVQIVASSSDASLQELFKAQAQNRR